MNLGRKRNSHSGGQFLSVFLVIFLGSVYVTLGQSERADTCANGTLLSAIAAKLSENN